MVLGNGCVFILSGIFVRLVKCLLRYILSNYVMHYNIPIWVSQAQDPGVQCFVKPCLGKIHLYDQLAHQPATMSCHLGSFNHNQEHGRRF